MSDKGGGGGIDMGPMVAATNKGIDLQKEIYDKNTALGKPWYDAGVSGVDRLLDLMGLQGGSNKSREQLAQELTPQFTTQTQNGPSGPMSNMYVDDKGTQYGRSDIMSMLNAGSQPGMKNYLSLSDIDAQLSGIGKDKYGSIGHMGNSIGALKLASEGGGTSSSVNYDALNKAIDEQMAAQGTPDDYGALAKKFGMEDFKTDPGYEFRMAEGNKALERAAAAQGKTMDPRLAKSLMGFNQDMATAEYGNSYNRYNNDQNNLFNRLAAISGFGQTSSGQLMAGGQNYANQVTDLTTGLANAQVAASNQGGGGSMFGGLSDLGTAAYGIGKAYTMFGGSDERIKKNIKLVGNKDDINVYEFDYIEGLGLPEGRFKGVMAQEIIDSHPEAVAVHPVGFLMVDYSQLPVKMERVCQ